MHVGDPIEVANRSPNRRKGDPIVRQMRGEIVRIIPASALHAPEHGETARVECAFETKIGGRFTAWLSSTEIRTL